MLYTGVAGHPGLPIEELVRTGSETATIRVSPSLAAAPGLSELGLMILVAGTPSLATLSGRQ